MCDKAYPLIGSQLSNHWLDVYRVKVVKFTVKEKSMPSFYDVGSLSRQTLEVHYATAYSSHSDDVVHG